MPRQHLAKDIECDLSLSRIVIYSYEAAHLDAELIEQRIKETFDWIKSVWVDCDAHHQVTVNLDVSTIFHQQSPARRYESFTQLIMYVVKTIGWDARRTALIYQGNTYRLNPS